MNIDNLCNYILKGKMEEAYEVTDINDDKIYKELFEKACDTPDITFYCFSQYMYQKTEIADWLDLCVSILCFSINWIDGAYQMALFHQRQLLEKRRNLNDLQMMLFFYEIPDVEFDQDEAISIAREILKIDPHNKVVHHIFPRLR